MATALGHKDDAKGPERTASTQRVAQYTRVDIDDELTVNETAHSGQTESQPTFPLKSTGNMADAATEADVAYASIDDVPTENTFAMTAHLRHPVEIESYQRTPGEAQEGDLSIDDAIGKHSCEWGWTVSNCMQCSTLVLLISHTYILCVS